MRKQIFLYEKLDVGISKNVQIKQDSSEETENCPSSSIQVKVECDSDDCRADEFGNMEFVSMVPTGYLLNDNAKDKAKDIKRRRTQQRRERFPEENLCSVCSKIIKKGRSGLMRHNLVHSDNFLYYCDLCPHRSKLKHLIEKHLKTHVAKELRQTFYCSFCSDQFKTKEGKRRHEKLRHTIFPHLPDAFKCHCGKAFKTDKRLSNHQRETHFEGEFQCEQCEKVFKSKIKLYVHMKNSHAEKSPCEVKH